MTKKGKRTKYESILKNKNSKCLQCHKPHGENNETQSTISNTIRTEKGQPTVPV